MLKTLEKVWFDGWIAIGSALALFVYCNWCGLGLTYDSFDYLSAAKSLNEQGTLLNADGSPYIFHGPLIPIFFSFFGSEPESVLRLVHLAFFAVTLILFRSMLRSVIQDRWVFVLCITAIGFSAGMQMVHHFIWSEPLFIALLAAHNWMLVNYLDRRSALDLWGLLASALLMALTRNAGFFFIIATWLILLRNGGVRSFLPSLKYLLFGSIGFIFWNIYVALFQEGTMRIYSNNPFLANTGVNLLNYLDILSQWFLPSLIPWIARVLFLLLMLIVLIVQIGKGRIAPLVWVFIIQAMVYFIIMFTLLEVDKDEIERLLSPIYPLLISAIALLLDRFAHKVRNAGKALLYAGLLMWSLYVISRGGINATRWHSEQCSTQVSEIVQDTVQYACQ